VSWPERAMKILLVCDYAPNDQHVGSRRWGRFIPELKKHDIDFRVLAPAWNGAIPKDSLIENSWRAAPIRRWVINGPPLTAWQYRKRAPLCAKIASGPAKSVTAQPKVIHAFKAMVIEWINRSYFPDVSWHVVRCALETGLDEISREKPDAILASHPFCGSLRLASELSRSTKIPWIADMRDGWSSYHLSMFRNSPRLVARLSRFEQDTLKDAKLVISATDGVNRGIQCPHNRRAIVYTGYNPMTYSESGHIRKGDDSVLKLALAGSVTEVHDTDTLLQGLKTVLQKRAGACELHYYGNYFSHLIARAKAASLPEMLFRDHGFVSLETLLPELHRADCLIALGMKGKGGAAYASARIFDYFAAERPILTASESENELTTMVKAIPGCFCCPSPDSVSAVLETLLNQKRLNGHVAFEFKSLDSVKKWSIEGQAEKMAKILRSERTSVG
jgi:hypothetical protein